MEKTYGTAPFIPGGKITLLLICGIILLCVTGCCTQRYTDETMQPLAATASDLARAVMFFAEENPAEAAELNDQELVQRAAAFDPNLLKPYQGLVVRGTVDGIILVCSCDGKHGLIEDAECSDKVDKLMWSESNAPCQFTLKPETVCP